MQSLSPAGRWAGTEQVKAVKAGNVQLWRYIEKGVHSRRHEGLETVLPEASGLAADDELASAEIGLCGQGTCVLILLPWWSGERVSNDQDGPAL